MRLCIDTSHLAAASAIGAEALYIDIILKNLKAEGGASIAKASSGQVELIARLEKVGAVYVDQKNRTCLAECVDSWLNYKNSRGGRQ